MTDKFDDLIRQDKDIKAIRLFAKEYYNSGKMGHTRKRLIERVADEYVLMATMLKKLEFSMKAQGIHGSIINTCPICKSGLHREHKEECSLFKLLKEVDA